MSYRLTGSPLNGSGLDDAHGTWEYSADGATGWEGLQEKGLALGNALLLPAGGPHRLRFVARPDFEGLVTCSECPLPRVVGLSCTPCEPDMTAGSITYVGWDGVASLPTGGYGDATYTRFRGAFSENSKTVDVVLTPAQFDTSVPSGAEFVFTYNVQDNVGNTADPKTRRLTILDRKPPIFTLRGPAQVVHEAGTVYNDLGTFAFDNHDGDCTGAVRITKVTSEVPAGTTYNADGSFGKPTCPGPVAVATATTQPQPELQPRAVVPAEGQFSSRVPHGTEFTFTFEVGDEADNKVQLNRKVVVKDTQGPVMHPASRIVPLEFVVGRRRRARSRPAQPSRPRPGPGSRPAREAGELVTQGACPLRKRYGASTIAELSCSRAVDVLEGDLTCHASVEVAQFAPSEAWSYATAALYDAPVVNMTEAGPCLQRRLVATGEVQEDCRLIAKGGLDLIDPKAKLHTRYVITYSATDKTGNVGKSFVTVIVSDSTPPEIVYDSDAVVEIKYGGKYDSKERLFDVSVVDKVDNRLDALTYATPGREVVNTVVPGEYTISYAIRDKLGNTATVYRTVRTLPNTAAVEPVACAQGGVCTCACEGGVEYLETNITLVGVGQRAFDVPSGHRAFKEALLSSLRREAFLQSSALEEGVPDIDDLGIGIFKRIDTSSSGAADTLVAVTMAVPVCAATFVARVIPDLAEGSGKVLATALEAQDRGLFPPSSFFTRAGGSAVSSLCADGGLSAAVKQEAAVEDEEEDGGGWQIPLIVVFSLFCVIMGAAFFFLILDKRRKQDKLDQECEDIYAAHMENLEIYAATQKGAKGAQGAAGKKAAGAGAPAKDIYAEEKIRHFTVGHNQAPPRPERTFLDTGASASSAPSSSAGPPGTSGVAAPPRPAKAKDHGYIMTTDPDGNEEDGDGEDYQDMANALPTMGATQAAPQRKARADSFKGFGGGDHDQNDLFSDGGGADLQDTAPPPLPPPPSDGATPLGGFGGSGASDLFSDGGGSGGGGGPPPLPPMPSSTGYNNDDDDDNDGDIGDLLANGDFQASSMGSLPPVPPAKPAEGQGQGQGYEDVKLSKSGGFMEPPAPVAPPRPRKNSEPSEPEGDEATPWLHGVLTRDVAEAKLKGKNRGTRHRPFNSTPMGDNSISSGSPHVRCTPMGRTCGEPDEIKKNTHPKNITALFRGQALSSSAEKPTSPGRTC